ncbi:unnamed protein product [Soboliphyme baturini]|uniref:Mediator of RNA polymerase II transcription subunit 16 n=1 Tax=Soboliphyme baturini TaxID=241478 RepID=A0A183IE47_9BILA|nr:unnamed protein product [Soboliphyme baturini]
MATWCRSLFSNSSVSTVSEARSNGIDINNLNNFRFDGGVTVYDRQGATAEVIALESNCTQLVWDKEGDILAVLTDNNNVVTLWNSNNRSTKLLTINLGVNKTSIVGKHTKRITCGDFNEEDLLALGSEDQQITISRANGDQLYSYQCTGLPTDLQFHDTKLDVSQKSTRSVISVIITEQNLMLIQLHNPQGPVSLQFQARYGKIVQYRWCNDELIIIGFQFGYIASISTRDFEFGQEMFSIQDQRNCLSGLTVSAAFGKLFTTGDSGLKLRNLSNLAEASSIISVGGESTAFNGVEVTDDGVMVAANVDNQKLQIYLTRLPRLGAAYQNTVAYMSSLYEITVTCITNKDISAKLPLTFEPKIVAVGRRHLGIAVNNRAWYYVVSQNGQWLVMKRRIYDYRFTGIELQMEKEYMMSIWKMKFNSRYACLFGNGKLIAHEASTSFRITLMTKTFYYGNNDVYYECLL